METIRTEAARIAELEEWLERVDLYCGIDVNMHTLIEYVHMRITPPRTYLDYVRSMLARCVSDVDRLATIAGADTPIRAAPFEHESEE